MNVIFGESIALRPSVKSPARKKVDKSRPVGRWNFLAALKEATKPASSDWWPDSFPDHVFLGEALQHWGRAQFHSKWTGAERGIEVGPSWSSSPSRETIDFGDAVAVYELFEPVRYKERSEARWLEGWPGIDLDEDDWLLIIRHQNALVEASRRWHAAVTSLVEQFRSGRIRAFTRLVVGGNVEALPRESWFYENYLDRFLTFRVDPLNPFETEDPDEWEPNNAELSHYLYVSREDLSLVSQALTQCPLSAENFDRLLPYLQLMLYVSARLELGSGPDPRHADVVKAIEQDMNRFIEHDGYLGKEKRKVMASFLRRPESGSTGKAGWAP